MHSHINTPGLTGCGRLTVSEVRILARALGGGVGARAVVGRVPAVKGTGLARIAIGWRTYNDGYK